MTLKTAVFASGGGTNFQALLDHQRRGGCWQIVLLVTDREDVGAIGRAEAAGVPTAVVRTKGRGGAEVGRDMLEVLERYGIDLVLLAGYLKLVPGEVLARFPNRVLNIHPALLPSFGGKGMYGMAVHRAVLESGARESGATVHFVDEDYDRGTIFAQRRVPVRVDDTPDELAARVLAVEHVLYPEAVDDLCEALVEGRAPKPMADRLPASGLRSQAP